MLARRIIPCLDIDKGRVVKGVNFVNLRDAGDAVANACFYDAQGADELVFLDITASHERRKTIIDLVKKVAEVVFMPFTVGGGIRTLSDIRALLLAGADKVSLNTSAVQDPALISRAAAMFGSQCIVVAIDARAFRAQKTEDIRQKTGKKSDSQLPLSSVHCSLYSKSKWEVYIHGGRTPTGLDVVKWAKEAQRLGAGEILLTSMDHDGTKDGYDLALTAAVSRAVNIPVIASGGAGGPGDFYEVFSRTRATAALAASIFHFRQHSIRDLKGYLRRKGIEVRS
jgi:imidazole glycerol-phosphate synthase subunit HisF